jgi:hypothetical protein
MRPALKFPEEYRDFIIIHESKGDVHRGIYRHKDSERVHSFSVRSVLELTREIDDLISEKQVWPVDLGNGHVEDKGMS